MRGFNKILIPFFAGLFMAIIFDVSAQYQVILDFETKDLDGNIEKLRDRLDPNKNYLFETMAFWCGPCVRSIDKFTYQQNYWRERFNLEIILIEDEHWDDVQYVSDRMMNNGWDLDIVISDKKFYSAGINSIPRYYFLQSGVDTLERMPTAIEVFLIGRLDSIFFKPVLDREFTQLVLNEDCDKVEVEAYQNMKDTTINNLKYHGFESLLFREDDQNGNVLKYDPVLQTESIYLKYSAPLCSEFWLKDREGDSISVKIMDIYSKDSIIHLVTDQLLVNECGSELVAFELIQDIGTNAGFFFDIEDAKIVSRLVCHRDNNQIVYLDTELEALCNLSTSLSSENSSEIRIYPNPASSHLNMEFSEEGEKLIEIYNANGALIERLKTSDRSAVLLFNKATVTSWMYVRIQTKNELYIEKFVHMIDEQR